MKVANFVVFLTLIAHPAFADCTGDQIEKMIDKGFTKDEIKEFCSSKPKFPQKWEIEEGSLVYEWQGYWLIKEDGTFSGTQRYVAKGLTMDIGGTIVIAGNRVVVEKTKVTDGNTCTYTGKIENNSVKGTYYCKSGGPYNWKAVIPN